MSLEAAVVENTQAIRDLIDAIKAGVPTTAAQVAAVVAESGAASGPAKASDQPAASDKNTGSSTQESPTAEAAAQETAPEAEASAAAGAESVTYDNVKAAILALSSKKGRDAVVALLGEFKVTKGPDLKPEQFAEFVAKANKLVEA